MNKIRILIMGAAGRDFHNFNVAFRDNLHYEVVAFTARKSPTFKAANIRQNLLGDSTPKVFLSMLKQS